MARKTLSLHLDLHSPRWGHSDPYSIEFDGIGFAVSQGAKRAVYVGERDGWSGHGGRSRNPLLRIMEDDRVYAPNVAVYSLVSLWLEWNDGNRTDEEVHQMVKDLEVWINATMANRPNSELWEGVL